MGKITVKSMFQAGSVWLVDYTESRDCCAGCGDKPRATVKIEQKKKPTQTQVENAINKSKGQEL